MGADREVRKKIIDAGRRMLDQWLTDLTGGNISARNKDTIYITPRFAGLRWGWELKERDIVSGRLGDASFEANERISREAPIHLAIYRAFSAVRAVIHAHPYHMMPFCVAEKPLPPVIEKADLFGVVPLCRGAAANSLELAENVVSALSSQHQRMELHAAAVMMPKHGVVVAGRDLESALYALAKLDRNAWCILSGLCGAI